MSEQGFSASLVPEAPADVDRAIRALAEASTPALLDTMSDLQLRLLGPDLDQRSESAWIRLERATQRELGRRKLRSERAAAKASQRADPLRARTLDLLFDGESTPSAMASALEVTVEAVQRVLAEHVKSGSVVRRHATGDEDARKRFYSLTHDGYLSLTRHHALIGRAALTDDQRHVATERYLQGALDLAVSQRRKEDALTTTMSRLRVIMREADKAGLQSIGLRSRAELSLTLRLTDDPQNIPELAELLDELDLIAKGHHENFDGEWVAAAIALYLYETGRRTEVMGGQPLRERTLHLITATDTYRQMRDTHREDFWARREAWTHIGLADNCRQLTLHEHALKRVKYARDSFTQLGDDYGVARCDYIEGTTQRLRGRYDESEQALHRAFEAAERGGFERYQVQIRAELGDVYRCRGQHQQAIEHLEAACKLAKHRSMRPAEAFISASIGATSFAADCPKDALPHLKRASTLFHDLGHLPGLALTMRRTAEAHHALGAPPKAIKALLDPCHELYQQLNSPAGLTSTTIARAITQGTESAISEAAERIVGYSRRRSDFRHLLMLDPHTPTRLLAFAEEAGRDDLSKFAHQIWIEAKGSTERRNVEQDANDEVFADFDDDIVEPPAVETPSAEELRVATMAVEPRNFTVLPI